MWRMLLLAVALAGCTSTPQATRERDAEAKRFLPRADAAVVYVYRGETGTALETDQVDLYVNDRLIGSTLPGSFFRFDVRAGAQLLHGYGYDQGRLKLATRNGEIYFVSLRTASGTSDFRLVAPETGKRDILRCCALFENWAPGQRPALY
jgi:hypothetical protein